MSLACPGRVRSGSTALLRALILAAVTLTALPASAVVTLHPDLRDELIRRGTYFQVIEQLREARDRGVFDMPADEGPVTGGTMAKKVTNWNALVILVDFSDQPATGSYNQTEFNDLIFSQGTYSTGSMKDFYLENSYGDFVLTGDVVGWYRMPHPMSYYVNNDGVQGTGDDYGFGSYPNNARKLYEDAVDAADPDVNYANYLNGRGRVRGVFIVHSGVGAETTGNASDLWSHQSGSNYATSDGVETSTYIFMPELQGSGMSTVGVFCHEFGHVLGLPDLYDTDGSSRGIGRWGLMGGGSWNGGGTRPAHYSAWSKEQLGFTVPVSPVANASGYVLPSTVAGPNMLKLQTADHAADEYLLLESRDRTGFDDSLPSEGLLVWHIDNSQSSNSLENCAGVGPSHPIVRLLQADDLCEMEADLSSGNAGDPYPGSAGVTTLAAATSPSTRSYDGRKSGVRLDNIAWDGSQASFDFILDETILAQITDNYADLASALAIAGSGDDVRLPAGYVATGNFTALGGVKISGGWDPSFSTQDSLNPSVIEGTSTLQTILNALPGSQALRLDNLILRNGRGRKVVTTTEDWRGGALVASDMSVELTRTRFENNTAGLNDNLPSLGGALALENCSTVIDGCSFAGNAAKSGGTIWASGGSLDVRNSHFEGSTLVVPLVAELQQGGAVFARDCDLNFDGVLVENYSGADEGGAVYTDGVATTRVTNSTLRGNSADTTGGGLFADTDSVIARGLDLDANTAGSGAGAQLQNLVLDWGGGDVSSNVASLLGGGVQLSGLGAGSRISAVALRGNSAVAAGSGMMISGGSVELEHLLARANTGSPTGAVLLIAGASVGLHESIVEGNTGVGAVWSGASPTGIDANLWWNNSGGDLSGASMGAEAVVADPGFVDAVGGDFHLGVGSPAIDAGRSGAAVDFDGSRADLGIFGGSFDTGGRPGLVQNFTWTETVPWSFELSWTDPVAAGGTPVSQVRLEGSPDGTSPALLVTVNTPTSTWTHVDSAQNVQFFYRAQAIDSSGRAGGWAMDGRVPVAAPELPQAFRVEGARPNPFNPATEFVFALPRGGRVEATVYDVQGRKVRALTRKVYPAGEHRLRWDGRDDQARRVASGTYFLRLSSPEGSATRRMVLVK